MASGSPLTAPEPTGTRPHFIPTLDGWRAIAVLMVISVHETNEHSAWLPGFLHNLHTAAAGVKIFFAISGYLITTLLLMEFRQRGSISLRSFYTRRVFRIMPPALTYLAFLSLATVAGWALTRPRDVLTALLLMANNLQEGYLTFHFWSLSLEEQFYLLWPAILGVLGPARAARFAAVAVAAVTLWRSIYGLCWWPVPVNRSDMTLDVFFVPCCLAILLSDPANRARMTRWLRGSIVLLITALIAIVEVYRPTDNVRHTVYAVALPLIVVSTVLHPYWAFSRFLELAPMRWVGRISYSLYLWQQIFTWSGLAHIPFAFRIAGLFGVAALSYYCIEIPFIRLGRRLIKSPTPSAAELGTPAAHQPVFHSSLDVTG